MANQEGSNHPICKLSGPKYHEGHGFRNQKPQILGTWTLWATIEHIDPVGVRPSSLLLKEDELLPSPSLLTSIVRSFENELGLLLRSLIEVIQTNESGVSILADNLSPSHVPQ